MQFHYKPDPKKARKPVARSSPEGLQPASLLSSSSADPNVFIMNSSVLTGQLDQGLLQQGLVSQALLPAPVAGEHRAGGRGLGLGRGGAATGRRTHVPPSSCPRRQGEGLSPGPGPRPPPAPAPRSATWC